MLHWRKKKKKKRRRNVGHASPPGPRLFLHTGHNGHTAHFLLIFLFPSPSQQFSFSPPPLPLTPHHTWHTHIHSFFSKISNIYTVYISLPNFHLFFLSSSTFFLSFIFIFERGLFYLLVDALLVITQLSSPPRSSAEEKKGRSVRRWNSSNRPRDHYRKRSLCKSVEEQRKKKKKKRLMTAASWCIVVTFPMY